MEERLRIVAVDNDRETLDSLNKILTPEYQVSIACDGPTALALLEECKPHLVILNTSGPDFDGFELLRFIRQCWDIPVIMLTPEADLSSLVRALAMGADDYVTKPFSQEEFAARVRAKLRRAWSGTFRVETRRKRIEVYA